MSPPGRPKGEYRGAQHEGTPVSPVLSDLPAVLTLALMARLLGTLQVHFPRFGFQIRKATTS